MPDTRNINPKCSLGDIVAEVRPWEDFSVDDDGGLLETARQHEVDKNDIVSYRCDAHGGLTTFTTWGEVQAHLAESQGAE